MKAAFGTALLLAGTAMAQTGTSPKPASLEGKVVNSVTKVPIRKVSLSLAGEEDSDQSLEAAMMIFGGGGETAPGGAKPPAQPASKSYSATSDASGKFRFDGVDPGDYYLKATQAGYADTQYKPQSAGAQNEAKIHVAAGDALTDLVISMVPHGAISGRVVDDDGDPIAGVMVSAMASHNTGGHARLTPVDNTTANNKGEFRLEKVPPGRYYISASTIRIDMAAAMGGAAPPPADGTPETGYVTTYFPGVTDTSEAQRVEVAAGADLPGLTIHLRKSRVVRVAGIALTADGAPMTVGSVMLMNPASIGSMQMGMIHPDGKFELSGVQPGAYMLMTVEMKGTSPSMQMHSLVVPAEGLRDLKLASLPEGTLQGKIVVAGDTNVKTAGMMVMMAGDEDAPIMPAMGRVSDTGTFSIKVSAAIYEFTFPTPPPGTYIKSVVLNGRDVTGRNLDLSGSPSGDVVVTLATDGGSVDALVSGPDGKPASDTTVVLLPSDPVRRLKPLVRDEETDATGHATFHDVPPGDYVAFAWKEVDDGDWLDADFLKPYEQNGQRVTVNAKGNEKAELRQIPAK